MKQSEILRFVDTIHRDKEIDKEAIFLAIESAYLTSVKKKYGDSESITVNIDRKSGEIAIKDGETDLEIEDLGRIAATTGKQVLFQKIREAERDVVFDEYSSKVGQLISGLVHRTEGPNLIISMGKIEGFLPRSEQVPGERFRVGERIKVLIQDIRKNTSRVRIILSRSSVDLVKALFEMEVPEIADRTIEIMGLAREPGYRTKIAVTTYDMNVDCVGACVGVRGSRIKNIVDELFGEKIDIVRWNESIEVLIMNALKPAEISSMDLDFETKHAKVYVMPDQQSIAIGKRGQNVRLASKLTGWNIDIVTVSEEELEKLRLAEVDEEGKQIEIGVIGSEGEGEAPAEASEDQAGETAPESEEASESSEDDSSESDNESAPSEAEPSEEGTSEIQASSEEETPETESSPEAESAENQDAPSAEAADEAQEVTESESVEDSEEKQTE